MDRTKSMRGTRKDDVFETLVEEILAGELAPGDPLVERTLAERFGLSRTPIREVLFRLQNEHLVDVFPNQGVFVRKLTPRDVRELFELREALEPLAARLAAAYRPDDAVDQMLSRFPQPDRQPPPSIEDLGVLGRFVHDALVEWSGNDLLRVTYATIRKHTQLVRSMMRTQMDIELLSLAEHKAILMAVKDRDPERAQGLMRKHLARSTNAVMNLILGPRPSSDS